jgi:hypothetical protein
MPKIQAFRPSRELSYGQHYGAQRHVSLPVPVRRPTGVHLALLLIGDVVAHRDVTAAQAADMSKEVTVPFSIHYLDPQTGTVASGGMPLNDDGPAYFGIPAPPTGVVGRLDDPKWLAADRIDLLRQRIYAALDVLLPFFADENRPWTEEANRAARDVRDFFPLAAEPGLWPYYKAEGKDFFAWVEKNAPPAKAPLPWEGPKQ